MEIDSVSNVITKLVIFLIDKCLIMWGYILSEVSGLQQIHAFLRKYIGISRHKNNVETLRSLHQGLGLSFFLTLTFIKDLQVMAHEVEFRD